MKKFLSLIFILFSCITFFGQTISVDDSSRNKEELVDLLIGNDCISSSNINLSSINSIAYFNNNNGAFPITEGVIIRNGIAKYSEGLYTDENLSSEISTNSDSDLVKISSENGQNATITDVAFLEFDFIPLATNFSFNFLFSSNEYGNFQCGFSDVFGIILTDIETGTSINLAIVPGTNDNISIQNIRDQKYNSSCNSINSNFFSTYNVNDPINSTLNMRGHTVVLNASATVVPNKSYRIKFAIGDYNDSTFDSAVFIEAGSFDAKINLGEDQSICTGNEIILDSGYTNTSEFEYVWEKDGTEIANETNPTLKVTEAGTYKLIITKNSGSNCIIEDTVVISDLQMNTPDDLYECYTSGEAIFNLTLIDQVALGVDASIYDVFYYNSLDNATNNIPISSDEIDNYTSPGNEKIYVKLKDKNTNNFCSSISNFNLLIVDEVVATTPDDITVCETDSSVNLPEKTNDQILNGLNSSNYTIKYYTSQTDADNDSNEIPSPTAFPLPANSTSSINIWARLINTTNNKNCFDIVSFKIDFSDSPLVDELEDVHECTEYILPALQNGKYYYGPNGTGGEIPVGTSIDTETLVYIYNINEDGCSNESSFLVFIAKDFTIPILEHCENFTIPSYPNAVFYTMPGGPSGGGTILPSGSLITTSQSIYFYIEIEDVFCRDTEYKITIHPLPPVDSFDDVITCDSYPLPAIMNGDFYDGNQKLSTGDLITKSTTIQVINIDPDTDCRDTSSFNITIIDTKQFEKIAECGSYRIPAPSIGDYFTEENGGGTNISGTEITTSQTIFYYADEVTTSPNCTREIEIEVTIHPLPQVDSLDDITRCKNDLPTLPSLVHGKYYSESGGNADNEILEGTEITTSQKIFIYNANEFCFSETNFNVDIRPIPLVDNFTDIFSCEPYTLPALTNGKYYTGSKGTGEQLNAGDKIETTQTIYIYNTDNKVETCDNENIFKINIFGVTVETPEDVIACESYFLPPLNVGKYYNNSGGEDEIDTSIPIETTQLVYIYAENGNRFFCSDEHSFTVNVFHRPIIDKLEDMEACGSITLPTSPAPNTQIDYYRDFNYTELIPPSEYTITNLGALNIYARVYPPGNPNCYVDDNFQITVYPLLDLEIQGGKICIDSQTDQTNNPFLLESNLDPNEFTVQWFLNGELVGTGPEYSAVEAGTYRVETIKLNPEVGSDCNYNPTEVIVEGSKPEFEVVFLTEDFADKYSIEIKAINTGLGNYVYSLDNGTFQNSNRFYNINPGNYTIQIRDLTGICPDSTIDFIALEHPKFFTPNGDKINDTWNIPGLKNDLSATIKIFSRQGRLITIIKPSEIGWGGENNNRNKEVSNDYWFLVEYAKKGGRAEYRGHFSMIRK